MEAVVLTNMSEKIKDGLSEAWRPVCGQTENTMQVLYGFRADTYNLNDLYVRRITQKSKIKTLLGLDFALLYPVCCVPLLALP